MRTTAALEGGPLSGGSGASAVQSPWIKLARDAFQRSTTYFDANYRKSWEDSLRMFQSKHPTDSKYNAESYRYRSRIFRPKSRSVSRKNEATAALAFFSNPDVVSIDPVNPDAPAQVASSVVMHELMQYRLTKTIPWFITLIGAFQDAMNVGIVASLQTWRYRSKMEKQEVRGFHPMFGEVSLEMDVEQVIEDRPYIDLIPVENIRFDPASHWNDVVGTSPYIVIQMPMYLNDVLTRMEAEDGDSEQWKRIDRNILLSARVTGIDPLRQARNDNREDAQAVTSEVNEFDVVMVHLNFIRKEETTYAYYTLRDTDLLSEPMPVEEMFLHAKDGKPPVAIGFCVIETHRPVPSSLISLTADLQRESNEIANQRLDNVKFVLNKRWLIRRGANIDVESLLRNVPGGVTMVNDVEKDALPVNWQDVTSSSYQEQDRVNVDFDELAGNFAQGSVLTNRKLNETVGGMRMMAQGANMLTEYTIRVFVETWVEPVLRQLMLMEEEYETDEVILAIAGEKARLFEKFGINAVTDRLLKQELNLSVNVGMGATDPDTRLQRFMQATGLYAKLANEGSPDLNLPEIRKTLFGLSGFRDNARFFNEANPHMVRAQKMMQEAESKARQVVEQAKMQLLERNQKLDDRETDLQVQQIELNTEKKLLQLEKQSGQNDGKLEAARADAVVKVSEAEFDMQLQLRTALHEQRMAEQAQAHAFALSERDAAHERALAESEQAWKNRLAEEKVASEAKIAEAKARKIRTATKDRASGAWTVTEESQ